jgi:hypothetical protein
MQLSSTSFEITNPKTDKVHKFSIAGWSVAVLTYIMAYGLRQILADAHSQNVVKGATGSKLTEIKKASDKAITDRLAKFASGEVPSGGGGGKRIPAGLVEFAAIVKRALGASTEYTAAQIVTRINKGESTRYEFAMSIAVRKMGRKVKKDVAANLLKGIEMKVAEKLAADAAKAAAEDSDIDDILGMGNEPDTEEGDTDSEPVA